MSLNFPNEPRDQAGRLTTEAAAGPDGQLLRLSAQADHLEALLDRLTVEVQASGAGVAALTRTLTDPTATQRLDEHLAEFLTRLETGQSRLDGLLQQVNGLNDAVARLTRTQFKSNALGETKEQQVMSALATLQDIVTRRDQAAQANVTQAHERLNELRSEARGELAVDLLPALDGVELALDSGEALLARRRAPAAGRPDADRVPAQPAGTWQRLRRALLGSPESTHPEQDGGTPAVTADETLDALEGWLRGLDLVRERFSSLLAAEGIRPIEAQGLPFDPHVHVAVEAEVRSDTPPGMVVAVCRKGYRWRARVLRYAEVVVSRLPEEPDEVAVGSTESRGQDTGGGPTNGSVPPGSEETK